MPSNHGRSFLAQWSEWTKTSFGFPAPAVWRWAVHWSAESCLLTKGWREVAKALSRRPPTEVINRLEKAKPAARSFGHLRLKTGNGAGMP